MEDGTQSEAELKKDALEELSRAAYRLSAADARLRGRATRGQEALSLPQARALGALAARNDVTVAQLAEAVEISGAGTTQLLNRLEREGLVERRRGQQKDLRSVTVRLTPAGRARHESRADFLDKRLASAFRNLTHTQTATVADALAKLARLYDDL